MSLFSDLGTLESAGLIRVAKVEPDLEFNFMHTLVQDAAYGSLLDVDRKKLHLAVAEALEYLYPDRHKELSAQLGYHFHEAGDEKNALKYFLMAGDVALAEYANQEAEVQYRSALTLDYCSEREIAQLYSGLGEALYRQGRFDESMEALCTGIDIYKAIEDPDGVAKLYARLARITWYKGDRPGGLAVCLEGMEAVRDAPDSLGKASLMHETARAYYFNGSHDKALPLCRQALKLAEQYGAIYEQADTLATLGLLAGITPEESLQALQKSVDLAEANGFYQVAMRAHQNLANMVHMWKADNESAQAHYYRSAELGKLVGSASQELIGLTSYITSAFSSGKPDVFEKELPRLEALVEKSPDKSAIELSIKALKLQPLLYRGDWDVAIPGMRECLELAKQQKNLEFEMGYFETICWYLLEENRWKGLDTLGEIERLVQDAATITERTSLNEKVWGYPTIAQLRIQQGRLEEARDFLEKFRSFTITHPAGLGDIMLAESEVVLATAEKNWEAALEWVEKWANLLMRAGERPTWSRSLLCWADIHIQRGKPADLERAQVLLRESLAAFKDIQLGYYPEIAQKLLQQVRARSIEQAIDHEKLTRDLKKARQVQESLLPETIPSLRGWGSAVILKPAFETSGDFYDFIPMPDGRLGLSIADVTDKGTSAALFMALSRSLWRTFASSYPDNPELTIQETNRRILTDTHGGLFITLFYAILNPLDGTLTYSSAGHHPAYVLRAADGSIQELARTGIPLGVSAGSEWTSAKVVLNPGDIVALYTDGITDAMNEQEEFYGSGRLKEVLHSHLEKSAIELLQAVLVDVGQWVGEAQQFDDITLMIFKRDLQG